MVKKATDPPTTVRMHAPFLFPLCYLLYKNLELTNYLEEWLPLPLSGIYKLSLGTELHLLC